MKVLQSSFEVKRHNCLTPEITKDKEKVSLSLSSPPLEFSRKKLDPPLKPIARESSAFCQSEIIETDSIEESDSTCSIFTGK
jgi:hypothetical protein